MSHYLSGPVFPRSYSFAHFILVLLMPSLFLHPARCIPIFELLHWLFQCLEHSSPSICMSISFKFLSHFLQVFASMSSYLNLHSYISTFDQGIHSFLAVLSWEICLIFQSFHILSCKNRMMAFTLRCCSEAWLKKDTHGASLLVIIHMKLASLTHSTVK